MRDEAISSLPEIFDYEFASLRSQRQIQDLFRGLLLKAIRPLPQSAPRTPRKEFNAHFPRLFSVFSVFSVAGDVDDSMRSL